MFIYCTSNILYSEITLHKTFHKYNIITIEFQVFHHFCTILHTALFINLRFKFYTYKFETYVLFCRLESIYIINYLGNTYVKSLPQLRYSDSIFTLTCTILAVNDIKQHLIPGQYILYNTILKLCLVWTSDESGENYVNNGSYNFPLYLYTEVDSCSQYETVVLELINY